jgi:hypothetical protein
MMAVIENIAGINWTGQEDKADSDETILPVLKLLVNF